MKSQQGSSGGRFESLRTIILGPSEAKAGQGGGSHEAAVTPLRGRERSRMSWFNEWMWGGVGFFILVLPFVIVVALLAWAVDKFQQWRKAGLYDPDRPQRSEKDMRGF